MGLPEASGEDGRSEQTSVYAAELDDIGNRANRPIGLGSDFIIGADRSLCPWRLGSLIAATRPFQRGAASFDIDSTISLARYYEAMYQPTLSGPGVAGIYGDGLAQLSHGRYT